MKNCRSSKLAAAALFIGVAFATSGCSALSPFGVDKGGSGDDQVQQTFSPTGNDVNNLPGAQQPVQQPAQQTAQQPIQQPTNGSRNGVVTQRAQNQPSTERQIMELRFEMKKLQAEISHLNTEITNLENRSDMWRNPQAIYNKRIVLTNGTIFNGNVVYQDEMIVKVETLIGSLVLQRNSITRILENVQDFAIEDFSDIGRPITRQPGVIREAAGYSPSATTSMRRANVVLDGTIKETKDNSGNTIFRGSLKNTGNRRADFVKVNFVIRKDWSGTTQTFTSFVDGAQFAYASGVTTDTTLPPGASGTFELYIPRTVGDFFGYSYSISWEEYE